MNKLRPSVTRAGSNFGPPLSSTTYVRGITPDDQLKGITILLHPHTSARRVAPLFALLLTTLLFAHAAFAQSPNTASLFVVVVDQNGAVVQGAKVSVANAATGDVREAVTGDDGSATIPGLSLTG